MNMDAMQAIQPHWQSRSAVECLTCVLRSDCFLANRMPFDDGRCRKVIQRRFVIEDGGRLYRLGSRCTALYLVCSGAIKTQRETVDGGLAVTGFYLPGDMVGVDALADNTFPADAIACGSSEICQLNYAELLSNCINQPDLNHWVITAISRYARRKDADLIWSSGMQSHHRVLRFFLDLHNRLGAQHPLPRRLVALPMRKQDIARYLNLTPETLSRNLARLRREGLLQVRNNYFTIPNAERARSLAGG